MRENQRRRETENNSHTQKKSAIPSQHPALYTHNPQTPGKNEMLSAHVLLFFLSWVSANGFSTYLVEERSEVCFYRYAEEKATLKAKVRESTRHPEVLNSVEHHIVPTNLCPAI